MLEHIPEELRALPQWVCCGDDKIPRNPLTGKRADFTNPADWTTFENARAVGPYVGFCLTANDPYSIIDLDDKVNDPATPEQKAFHHSICATLKSYVEQSISGRGLHLICKAKLLQNRNCKEVRVEMYDRDRFFLLTGECWNNPRPILEAQEFIDQLYANLPRNTADDSWRDIDIEDYHLQVREDHEVASAIQKGQQAALFDRLWNGDMSGHNNDHSVADEALLAILTWWTPCNAQIVRMWQSCPLGNRQKSHRLDYIKRTLSKARAGRELASVDFSHLRPPMQEKATTEVVKTKLPSPPGAFGRLVDELLETMARPVPEIAMVAALGALAGIFGRQWNISRPHTSGLNLYLILLGGTGVGKDQIPQCIDFIVSQIAQSCPDVHQFVGPGEFASAESMTKTLGEQPCFVSVIGEIGKKMTSWNDATQANPVASQIKRTMLDLYSKSGKGHSVKARVYANKEKDTRMVEGPAMTLVGESSPEAYYENLTESMITEGFMPRWLVLQYEGLRLHARDTVRTQFSDETLGRLTNCAATAISLCGHNEMSPITFSDEADRLAKQFDRDVDDKINEKLNDVSDQLWNRAALKAYRIAGLLAVLENPYQPTVTVDQFKFAQQLITMEIAIMSEKFENGEIGSGDAKQLCEVKRMVREFYASLPAELHAKYSVPEKMSAQGLVPYGYLQRRTACMSCFRKDRAGSTAALHRVLQTLANCGELVEVGPSMVQQAGYAGKAYKIPGK